MLPQDIVNKYETQHLRNQAAVTSVIADLWDEFIRQASLLLIQDLPIRLLNERLNDMLRELADNQTLTIQTGIQRAWQISNEKTFAFLDKRLQGETLPPELRAVWYDPNDAALDKFIARKDKGLGLSDRVWKNTNRAQSIINAVLKEGVATGTSETSIGRKLKTELISEVKTPSPGKGIYRSPVRNAQRLTRTETNMAYRDADNAAWANNPIILGYKIQLSKSGKPKIRCEVCRSLEGTYPTTFKWNGWHPQCLCFKTPVLMNRQQMDEYMQLIASGQDTAAAVEAIRIKAGLVKVTPDQFNTYLRNNYERIEGWKSTPYWIRDNRKVVETVVKN